jgi:hypothetical protein
MDQSYDVIHKKVNALRDAARERDQRHRDVHDIRSSQVDTVIPGAMPDAWPRPVIANMIDAVARDKSEVMGQMPAVNCTNSLQTSDRSKKFSSKRTKIANYYLLASQLQAGKQIEFCDHYETFGMAVYSVEPDFERQTPVIRIEHPQGVYPEFGLFGELRSYTKLWREEAIHLVAKFPHLIKHLKRTDQYGGVMDEGWAEREIEVAKYTDDSRIYMYLPDHSNLFVDEMPNPMGRLTISIAKRPSFDREIRGAYDDAIWVYLAKSRMAMLGLEAAEKSVRAPLAIPRDVQNMVFGSDAILRTDSPEKIKRVGVDLPQFAMQEAQILEQELRLATRQPQARSGNIDASIITGKGVEALMGGFDTVITAGQQVISQALRRAIEMAFDMDEKLWGNQKKTIRGVVQGAPFEEDYVPAKDIGGNHTVDVTYGFAAGQDPARAIVALLQLRSDQLVSRDFVQRQLPMEIDVVQMQQQIDTEQFEDAMKAGMQQTMQSLGSLILQGQDPMELLVKLAKVMDLREKGKPVHEAVLAAFKPAEAPPGAAQGGPGQPPQGPPGAPPVGPSGAPQGAPDMMQLLASLKSNGQAQMNVRTRRQVPI